VVVLGSGENYRQLKIVKKGRLFKALMIDEIGRNRLMEDEEELRRIRERKRMQFTNNIGKNEFEKEMIRNNPSKPVEVTDASFTNMVQNNPLVVIDFWAAWCTPCHMVAPIIEEMARDYGGRVVFAKMNVDENRKIAMQHGIMSIPTLLIFKEGNLVDRIVGAVPRQMLEAKIKRHL
jgi:thioredoxin 1